MQPELFTAHPLRTNDVFTVHPSQTNDVVTDYPSHIHEGTFSGAHAACTFHSSPITNKRRRHSSPFTHTRGHIFRRTCSLHFSQHTLYEQTTYLQFTLHKQTTSSQFTLHTYTIAHFQAHMRPALFTVHH